MIFVWDWVSVIRDEPPLPALLPSPLPLLRVSHIPALGADYAAGVPLSGPSRAGVQMVPDALPSLTCASKSPFPL